MELLPDELRRPLPPILKIHNLATEGNVKIYCKLFTRRTGVTFYVAEGEQRGADYLLWGLLIAPPFKFPMRFQISLSRLQTKDWLGQEPCGRDASFQPVPWNIAQRDIPNLRRPL